MRALQSTPGVQVVRGYSMFGMSFVYAIFDDDTDIYWARTRVLEQTGQVQQQLPAGVSPTLGPDASGVGWVYQYVLEDTRQPGPGPSCAPCNFTVRPALQGVQGVAEVASLGGFERQYQILLDPDRLPTASRHWTSRAPCAMPTSRLARACWRWAAASTCLRGRGYARTLDDLEQSVVSVTAGGVPVRVRDVATVQFGPEIRRGAADYNGIGEAVGGIVAMRIGSNALDVIRAVEAQIETLPCRPACGWFPPTTAPG